MFFSSRKLAANRANSQKSTGPISDAGLAKSATNGRKHGLTGRFTVMPGENQEAFDNLFQQFMLDEKPVGSVEVELVRKMAEHTWLRERAARCQEACFVVMPQTPEQAANDEAEVRVRPELERYIRYQSHHDRAYQRAAAELLKRQKERRLAERGFVSQKHDEADETRKAEIHPYKVSAAKAQAEREQVRTEQLKSRAAATSPSPQPLEKETVSASAPSPAHTDEERTCAA
jgi:hypothetical protein